MRHLLFTLLILLGKQTLAGTCETVSDGLFNDPANWNCGCDPLLCDTIVVKHVVYTSAPINLGLQTLRVDPQGEMVLNAPLSSVGMFINLGEVTSTERMTFHPGAEVRNHGTWSTKELHYYFTAGYFDTLLNTGSLHVSDTAWFSSTYPTLINDGSITGGHFELAEVRNHGEMNIENLYCFGLCANEGGIIHCSHYLWIWSFFSPEANSTTTADSLIVTGNMSLYAADVVAHSLLSIGTPTISFGTVEVPTNQTLYCEGDFINYGEVTGSGDICVQGLTANYGQITSTPDICDKTLTATSPPFLDINTGTVGPNVNWCANADCSTLGLGNHRRRETLTLSPNPTTDRLTINGLPGTGPWNVQLFDLQGRAQAIRTEQRSDGVMLYREGLAAGCYTVVVAGDAGTLHSAARVVFVDP